MNQTGETGDATTPQERKTLANYKFDHSVGNMASADAFTFSKSFR